MTDRGVEHICRECGFHVGGEVAAARVRWVSCEFCVQGLSRPEEAVPRRGANLLRSFFRRFFAVHSVPS